MTSGSKLGPDPAYGIPKHRPAPEAVNSCLRVFRLLECSRSVRGPSRDDPPLADDSGAGIWSLLDTIVRGRLRDHRGSNSQRPASACRRTKRDVLVVGKSFLSPRHQCRFEVAPRSLTTRPFSETKPFPTPLSTMPPPETNPIRVTKRTQRQFVAILDPWESPQTNRSPQCGGFGQVEGSEGSIEHLPKRTQSIGPHHSRAGVGAPNEPNRRRESRLGAIPNKLRGAARNEPIVPLCAYGKFPDSDSSMRFTAGCSIHYQWINRGRSREPCAILTTSIPWSVGR